MLLLNVKWGHGHTWMCCDKLAQRRQMVMGRRLVVMPFAAATWIDTRAAERPHTHTHTPLRVILTLVYPHMHKHPSELWHTMPPYTILPSPLVSMMCAAEALADCQRLCARLRSERREDAEGFDRETALRLMVGWWEPQHRLLQRDAPPLMYCTCQQAVLFTGLLS